MVFFPSFYPDELFYSTVSRFLVYGGGISDLMSSNVKANVNFINVLNSEFREILDRYCPFNEILENHTMLPYFIRFMPLKTRRDIYLKITAHNRKDNDYMRKKNNRRVLRYCPLCVKYDRDQYGEAYWHREHQINSIDFCATHKCKLHAVNADFSQFIALENCEIYFDTDGCFDSFLNKFTDVVCSVFREPINLETELCLYPLFIKKFPNAFFYDSDRVFVKTQVFFDSIWDYQEMYFENKFNIDAERTCSFVFNKGNPNISFDEFCLLATLFDIPFEEIRMVLKGKSDKLTDHKITCIPEKEILIWFNRGYSFLDISKAFDIPPWIVYDFLRSVYGSDFFHLYHM